MDHIRTLASQIRRQMDGALKDHWDSKRRESCRDRGYDAITKLHIEDRGRNDNCLQ